MYLYAETNITFCSTGHNVLSYAGLIGRGRTDWDISTLCLNKLSYGQTQRLFGQQMSSDRLLYTCICLWHGFCASVCICVGTSYNSTILMLINFLPR